MAKVLVTGGTGFMGSAVVLALLQDGQSVRVLVRPGTNMRNLKGLDVELAYGDITDPAAVQAAVDGCGIIYHLAAMVSFWTLPEQTSEYYRVNVEGSKNIFAAALKAGVDRFVYTSTISTIGSYGEKNLTREDHDFNLWEMCSDYERSKYSAEFEAWRFAARGLPLVAVLPAAPVGARDIKPNPVGRLILDFLAQKLPGYIEGGGNFIDVDDVAQGHLLAAKHGKVGERYILAGANIKTHDLFKALEAVSGVPAPTRKIPYSVALNGARLFEFVSNNFTHKPPMLTAPMVKFSSKHYFVDGSKARQELGFVPQYTPVDALVKAIAWFLDNGYIQGGPKDKISRHMNHANIARPVSA